MIDSTAGRRRRMHRCPSLVTDSTELDALGQRQIVAPVDRAGLSPHVVLPGIGTGLSSATGILLAPERPADLGATGADVHVGDAAVGAGMGQEPLGHADRVGEDRAGESLVHRVLLLDGGIEVFVLVDVQQWCEGLVPRDGGIGSLGNTHDRRRREVARGTGMLIDCFDATGNDRTALLDGGGDGVPHRLDGVGTDEWTHEGPGIHRVADGHGCVGGGHPLGHRIDHAAVAEEPTGGRATLAGGPHGPEEGSADDQFQVGILGDDDRVVATQFQQAAAESLGDRGPHVPAHPAGSRGADQRQASIGDHGLADLVVTADDEPEEIAWIAALRVEDVLVAHDLVRDVRHRDGAQGRHEAGLPDHRVSTDGGEHRVPGPDGHREVEGGDDADGSQRVPLLVHAVQWTLGVDRQSVELTGEPDGEVRDVDALDHFAHAFGVDLSHFHRDQGTEFLFLLTKRVADATDDLASLGSRQHAPVLLHGLRTDHGVLVVGSRLQADGREGLAGGGVDGYDAVIARGRRVDDEGVLPQIRDGFGVR